MQSVDEAADVIHQLLRGRHAIDSVRQALAPLVVLDDAKSSAETLDPAAVGFEFREGLQMRNHAWDDYQVGGVVLATGSIRDLQLAAGSVAEATIDHRPLPCIRIRCSSAFQNLPRPVAGQSAGGRARGGDGKRPTPRHDQKPILSASRSVANISTWARGGRLSGGPSRPLT